MRSDAYRTVSDGFKATGASDLTLLMKCELLAQEQILSYD